LQLLVRLRKRKSALIIQKKLLVEIRRQKAAQAQAIGSSFRPVKNVRANQRKKHLNKLKQVGKVMRKRVKMPKHKSKVVLKRGRKISVNSHGNRTNKSKKFGGKFQRKAFQRWGAKKVDKQVSVVTIRGRTVRLILKVGGRKVYRPLKQRQKAR
jgi:hypothetical protein